MIWAKSPPHSPIAHHMWLFQGLLVAVAETSDVSSHGAGRGVPWSVWWNCGLRRHCCRLPTSPELAPCAILPVSNGAGNLGVESLGRFLAAWLPSRRMLRNRRRSLQGWYSLAVLIWVLSGQLDSHFVSCPTLGRTLEAPAWCCLYVHVQTHVCWKVEKSDYSEGAVDGPDFGVR